MDFNKMCRICLREDELMSLIFDFNDGQGISLPNKIMACSSVQVSQEDRLPQLICSKCLIQLDIAYEFQEKCQSSDLTLKKYLYLMQPFYSSETLKLEAGIEEGLQSVVAEGSNCREDLSSNSNVYEFDKEDTAGSGTSMDENKLCVDANDSDSDAPLSQRQATAKQRKKWDKPAGKRKKKAKKMEEKKKEIKEEKDVECPICNKTFAYMCILKDHMVQHTGAKPYLCSACGKSFAHTASLTNHMKTHYSDKPHKCDHCKLSFHRRAHLVLHLRTHTGEKPFVCEVCGRDFAQASYLKEHMRVHSGEKPFVCDICNHGFARKSCLVMHRRVHTGELPYACPECGRAFSQRSQRKRHVKRNHKGSPCLRSTGELILKDLDSKNRIIQEEKPEDVMSLEKDGFVLLAPHHAGTVNTSHFLYPQDTTSSVMSASMPLTLPIQIQHRTLLQ